MSYVSLYVTSVVQLCIQCHYCPLCPVRLLTWVCDFDLGRQKTSSRSRWLSRSRLLVWKFNANSSKMTSTLAVLVLSFCLLTFSSFNMFQFYYSSISSVETLQPVAFVIEIRFSSLCYYYVVQ